MIRQMMEKNKDKPTRAERRADKRLEKEYSPRKLPKNWPSPDHHKCDQSSCEYPNLPTSVPGKYHCLGCRRGTYVVTVPQAAKIHDEAQRAFRWHEERRKERTWRQKKEERIDEERAIGKYLKEEEEMRKEALKLKVQGEKERRLAEAQAAELRAEEEKRLAQLKGTASWAQEAEEKWWNHRQHKRDDLVKIRTVIANEPRMAKVEHRAAVKSTVVQVETPDTGSVSSISLYSQPSYVSRSRTKPLPPSPVPPIPSLSQARRRPLTPDSSHTVSSQESYSRPRFNDLLSHMPPSPEPLNVKRRDTTTTTVSQISAANYYASQAGAQFPPFPRASVRGKGQGTKYYF
ncbi:hypothetical protein K435DRAFT_411385 [Dendrothele bispora CBS 962.96]|uniref:Uncharacterized protein n=1 Tax=Dendrothele bispora (strain CBS 962.96) TaxID=1314807 RepID=A0A4S8L6B9_DENBC|nr:hypothetical protein K435DRAFT_411385 [Dendrothele bispora CBS 962.96]